jgi:TrmH family RNA methyltransferase
LKVIGTSSNEKNSFKKNNSFNGILLFGNESHGINKNLFKYVDEWLSINRIGNAESLNVSVATGIILNELTND